MSKPLLEPVNLESATREQAEMLAKLPPMGISRLLAHAPALLAQVMPLGMALMSDDATGLPADLREAIIIRTGKVLGSAYVEGQHRRVGAMVGLSDVQIEAAAEGADHVALPENWRPAMRIVEAGLAGKAANQSDVDAVMNVYGSKGVLGLLVTAGFFSLFSAVTNALALPLDLPGNA